MRANVGVQCGTFWVTEFLLGALVDVCGSVHRLAIDASLRFVCNILLGEELQTGYICCQ